MKKFREYAARRDLAEGPIGSFFRDIGGIPVGGTDAAHNPNMTQRLLNAKAGRQTQRMQQGFNNIMQLRSADAKANAHYAQKNAASSQQPDQQATPSPADDTNDQYARYKKMLKQNGQDLGTLGR